MDLRLKMHVLYGGVGGYIYIFFKSNLMVIYICNFVNQKSLKIAFKPAFSVHNNPFNLSG